jgi:hypothetical protein
MFKNIYADQLCSFEIITVTYYIEFYPKMTHIGYHNNEISSMGADLYTHMLPQHMRHPYSYSSLVSTQAGHHDVCNTNILALNAV